MLTILSRCLITTMYDEYTSNWVNEEVALQKISLRRTERNHANRPVLEPGTFRTLTLIQQINGLEVTWFESQQR